jgi:DNA-binding MarR family transcriptional regulator
LLAHLDEQRPVRATRLAKHLGVAASTLSAAIARLAKHGYVIQQRERSDGRAIGLLLSAKGAQAMQASSVLETERVKSMLGKLTPRDRSRALAGLAALARAARAAQEN